MKNNIQILIAVLLIQTLSFGQNVSTRIDSILNHIHQEYPETAISLGLIHKGKEYYLSYGKLNRESDIDINKNSVFEIASITKVITGNLLAQAVIDKKLELNNYIDSYLPTGYILQDNLKNKIRISDLASHQSGLPDINFPELMAKNPQQPAESVHKETIITLINDCEELTDYGKYRYSTMGFILLGQILEQVYKEDYETILNRKLIAPLQLQRTFTKDFNTNNITAGYNQEGGLQELLNWNITAPAGLIKSSSSDMLSYLKAILSSDKGHLSKASTIAENSYYKDANIEMGLGINIIRDGQQIIYAKTGDIMGQSSVIAYNRSKKWGLIIMINERNPSLRNALFNMVYDVVN
ncbi:serine hydrolase [Flavobacteriaceae bacterium R38]|nr:serine hydrolase [Flavobacteriaceae bacterium R38]